MKDSQDLTYSEMDSKPVGGQAVVCQGPGTGTLEGSESEKENDDLSWLALTVLKNISDFNSSSEPRDIALRFLNHIKKVSIYLWIMGVHGLQIILTVHE